MKSDSNMYRYIIFFLALLLTVILLYSVLVHEFPYDSECLKKECANDYYYHDSCVMFSRGGCEYCVRDQFSHDNGLHYDRWYFTPDVLKRCKA